MTPYIYSVAALAALILAACQAPPKPPEAQIPPAGAPANPQLDLQLASGTYNCERGVRIKVEREAPEAGKQRIKLGWKGGTFRLERDPSFSGLPRFENLDSGLVWIDLPWKGLLLDAKTSKPLANECRPA